MDFNFEAFNAAAKSALQSQIRMVAFNYQTMFEQIQQLELLATSTHKAHAMGIALDALVVAAKMHTTVETVKTANTMLEYPLNQEVKALANMDDQVHFRLISLCKQAIVTD